MPIYDYICSSCATRTEFIHGIDAPRPRFCPTCGAEDALRKAIVPPAVHFKGSGWAKKDRSTAAASKAKAAGADGSGDASAGAKDGGSGDGASSSEGASTAKESSGTKATDSGKAKSAPAAPTEG